MVTDRVTLVTLVPFSGVLGKRLLNYLYSSIPPKWEEASQASPSPPPARAGSPGLRDSTPYLFGGAP
jgi:hypothetical protein